LGGSSELNFKIPVSVLVVIHTRRLDVLLLERADHPGYWQSVTGSQDESETLEQTAVREVREETGLDASAHVLSDWRLQNEYEIFPEWRWRYAPGVTHNTEHVFGLEVPAPVDVRIAPR
jgi:dATP pyrophosphohydrolase